MGRRKWKLFQENLSRSQHTNIVNSDYINLEQKYTENLEPSIAENHISEKKEFLTNQIKKEIKDNFEEDIQIKKEIPDLKTIKTENIFNSTTTTSPIKPTSFLHNLLIEDDNKKPPNPTDWNPSEKCYFCVDGKLLTVNEKGELVAESGSALTAETELANRSTVDTDSGDSRNSTPDILRNQSLVNVKKLIASQKQQQQQKVVNDTTQKQSQHQQPQIHPPKMTSLESMAARLAGVASIHPSLQPNLGQLNHLGQLGQIFPGIYYQQLAQMLPNAGAVAPGMPVAAISPSNKDSPSPLDTVIPGEQPLDLSAKPTSSSPALSTGEDSKTAANKSKSRTTPIIPGRRTYTEEELQNALQDIMNGKLGTRRAAVIYGIPRSTLRNKVYKMIQEQKRETSTPSSVTLFDADDDEENDNENDNDTDRMGLSDDDTSDNEKIMDSSLCSDQEQQGLSYSSPSLQKHRHLNNRSVGGASSNDEHNKPSTPLVDPVTQVALAAAAAAAAAQNKSIPPQQTPWTDPNVLLQTMLLSSQLAGGNNANLTAASALASLARLFTQNTNTDDPEVVQDLLNILKHQQEELSKKLRKDSNNLDNSCNDKEIGDSLQLSQNLKQQQQLGHLHQQQHLPKSETPDTGSTIDINETSEDGVILKIPSFKPVVLPASSSSTASSMKSCDPNQISPSSTASTHHGIAPLLSRSPHQSNNLSGISPPLMRQSSESQSPPGVSMREIIANSLNRFNQQNIKEHHNSNKSHPYINELTDDYGKRPNISVIKNIGGTDITKFASTPNMLHNYQNASQCAVGKGTRPKRGKYRNYDRDSLTEAVKAVQRGEMSVHRAGSYYGVPHSTLEYKVKERHLMRPRKREPKPQPLDGSSTSGSNSTNSKHSNIPGLTSVNNLDKLKTSVGQQKSSLKPNQTAFPNTSPNGMKVSLFDPLAAQLQYPPHFFWQNPAGFNSLPMEFSPTGRPTGHGNGNSSGNSTATSPGQQTNLFSPNAENFLTTQMIQRFQEESRLNAASNANSKSPSLVGNNNASLNNNNSNSITNNNNNNNSSNVPPKTARELAQSLYDSKNVNGSFLDGIIRQTLDRKTNSDIPPHGPLFDQLMKNTKPMQQQHSQVGGPITEIHTQALVNALTSNKRSASPNMYPVINIKRERSSSPSPISNPLLSNLGSNNIPQLHHLKRNSINDDTNDSDVKTHHDSSSADSLIKSRLESFLIKSEVNENLNDQQHHNNSSSASSTASGDLLLQRHHTNPSLSSSLSAGLTNQNNIINNLAGSVSSISHSNNLEDINGKNNGENGDGTDNTTTTTDDVKSINSRTDNDLMNKNSSRGASSNSISLPSDDLILKTKLGLIKSETEENL